MLLDQGPPVSGQTFMLPWGRGWGFTRTLEQSRGKDALSLLSFTVLELEPVKSKAENTTGVLHRTQYDLGYVDAQNPKQPTVKKEGGKRTEPPGGGSPSKGHNIF